MTGAVRLNVLRAGAGSPALFLHGIGSSATAWRAQFERLGDGRAGLAPDLPGYGDSDDPAADADADAGGLDAIVDAVAAAIVEPVLDVVGVSFGALVAMRLALRHAGRVRSLVLCDATLGRASAPPAERAKWLAHRAGLAADLVARSGERAREIAGPDAAPSVVAEIAAHMRRARPAGYLAVARAIAGTDARPWLASIGQPTLVLCGEHDTVTGPAVSRALAEGLPRATLQTIAGAGHAPHIETPDVFAASLRRFWSEERSPARA